MAQTQILMSDANIEHLMAFSPRRKLAFLLLLYQRMLPELHSFYAAHGLNHSPFDAALEGYWSALGEKELSTGRTLLLETLRTATIDTEDFGSLEASIALNAALVLQAIERFLMDRNDQPVLDAMTYCFDTLYFDAMRELGTEIALEDVAPRRLVQREAWVQNEDIEFLGTMKDRPWNAEEIRGLRRRADGRSLLGA